MSTLQCLRQQSLDHFTATGFPSRKEEHWKYTDLSFLSKQIFSTPETITSLAADAIKNYSLNPSYRVVFVNGFYSAALSSIAGLESEAELFSMQKVLLPDNNAEQQGSSVDLIKQYLTQKSTCRPGRKPGSMAQEAKHSHPCALDPCIHAGTTLDLVTNDQLIHWNMALMFDGIFIRVPKNCHLSKPIHVLFFTPDNKSAKNLYSSRNIIVLEENSQAVIFEEHVSTTSDEYFKNVVTQIDLRQGSNLHYYKLQQEANDAVHLATTHISQARDSQLRSHSISLGAKLARDDFTVALNEVGATCDIHGLYLPKTSQHIDHHTRIDHYAAHTRSEEYYKGILSDQATAVYNGKVIVHPNAQKINSKQTNKNLLLTSTAEVNTKPELEIYADDVQCAHGATVAQVDAESLFYLRSRGLSETIATALLVQAFADEILTRIPNTEIRDYVHRTIYN
jgi:Fe-S cluster assembly protein SufD